MDIEDQIPPPLFLQKGGIPPLWKRGVRGDFQTIHLFNYGLLSNLFFGSFRSAWRATHLA